MTTAHPKPSKSRLFGPLGVAALFCMAALAASMLLFDRAFLAYDDGIAAEGARQVLNGSVPYRDFWALYAPGSYYVNALLIALFGPSFLSIRLALPLMAILQAGMLFGIMRRLVRSRAAAVAAGAAYVAFIPIGILVTNPLSYWLTAAFGAFYCFVRWVEDHGRWWAYACGALLGISALFRQDGGVYAAFALTLSAFIIAPRKSRWGSVLAILGPFAAIGTTTAAFFAYHGALGAMIDDVFTFALTAFPHSRDMPYPMPWDRSLIMGPFYAPASVAFIFQLYTFWLLPPALAVAGAVGLWRMLRSTCRPMEYAVCALACAAAVLFMMISVRPSAMRISGSILLGLVVFAAMSTDRNKALRVSAITMLALGVLAFGSYGPAWVWGHRSYSSERLRVRGGIYGGRGYALINDAASSYIHQHTSPGEKILSGSPAMYFMSERDAATRYSEPHPCLTDTPKIQRIMIDDLERNRVRYVVRARDWVTDGWFTIEPEHQPRELIRHIRRNYRLERSFGVLQVYKRGTPFRARGEQ